MRPRPSLLLAAFFLALSAQAQPVLEIVHLNIGQGDATLILGPPVAGERVSVLVDAGNIRSPDGGAIVHAALTRRGLAAVDYFVASHYDADHIGGFAGGQDFPFGGTSFVLGPDGLPDTPDDIAVGTVVDRGTEGLSSDPSDTYVSYRAIAGGSDYLPLVDRDDVENFTLDLGHGATLRAVAANGWVLGRPTRVPQVNTENERSIALLLTYRGFDYLIGGDTIGRAHGNEDARVEEAIGAYLAQEDVDVDVLHVNHHGANNASDAGFLGQIAPEVAIISTGNGNTHAHPNTSALSRLATAGVRLIYQTEGGESSPRPSLEVRRRQAVAQGDVIVRTNGRSYEVRTSQTFPVDE